MKRPFLILLILVLAIFATSATMAQDDTKLRINGYMTAAYAISSVENPYPKGFGTVTGSQHISRDPNYSALSRYGIQFLYDTGENVEMMVQITGSGQNDFQPETDWALIKYKFNDSLAARMGKIRLPFYLYSDTLEVSFTYPWLRPPYAAYDESRYDRYFINNLNGIDLLYNWQFTDDYELSIQLISGEGTKKVRYWTYNYTSSEWEERDSVNTFREMNAFNVALNGESWTFKIAQLTGRGSYIENMSTDLNPALEDYPTVWSDVSFRFDNGTFLFVAERTAFGYDPPEPLSPLDITGTYATIGYRFSRFMPHITQSNYEYKITGETGTLFEDDYTLRESTTAIGLRTEINDYSSFKIEYHQVKLVEGIGKFGSVADSDLEEDDSVEMYMAGIDMVF
jgi:hypothetical protein